MFYLRPSKEFRPVGELTWKWFISRFRGSVTTYPNGKEYRDLDEKVVGKEIDERFYLRK